jgi:alkanesulfonate monooxygenase SsuD/methylene tetrahydromethanopterin reductase-like flavin-dependent oxidoreductase (luciferase family)
MPKLSFGWITQSAAKDGAQASTLFEDNVAYARAFRPPFDTLWFEDHLQWDQTAVFESWTFMVMMSAIFPKLRCGSLVLSQSFRKPALVAKMGATLQAITDGRLILGIGAGWKQDEYASYGYPFPSSQVRLEELEEAVTIIKKLWHESPATYHGKHFAIEEAYCEPRPQIAPPLLIGGAGEKVTLRIVAKHADWMNLLFADIDMYRQKQTVLQEHCSKVNRDPSTITNSLYAYVLVTPEGRKPARRSNDKYIIFGTPEKVAEELTAFIEAGVHHFMLRFLDFPSLAGQQLFQEKVAPLLENA